MGYFCFQINVNYKYNCACHALGCAEAKIIAEATATRIKMRIVESLARFIAFSTAQRICAIS